MSGWVDKRSERRHGRRASLRLLLTAAASACVVAGALVPGALASGAAEGLGITIGGNATGLLYPDQAATPIDLTFGDANDDSVTVSALTVSIVSVSAPNATAELPCTLANFALTQFSGSEPFAVPSGSSTLLSLGFARSTWPTLQIIETHENQDGCEGATVHLVYGASGQDGPAPTTPTANTAVAPTGLPTTTTSLRAAASTTPTATTTTTTTTTPRSAVSRTVTHKPPVVPFRPVPFTPPARVAARNPSIGLSPETQSVSAGGEGKFSVTVRNSSGVRLTHVTVTDALAPDCTRSIGALAAGRSRSYSCSRSGVRAGFADLATVSGRSRAGATVSASASAHVELAAAPATAGHPRELAPAGHPGIAIYTTRRTQTVTTSVVTDKTLSSSRTTKGYGSAHFKVKVTNTGDVSLRAVTVADDLAAACNRSIGTLPAGASRSYRCVVRSVRQSFTNAAVATGTDIGKVTASSRAAVEVRTRTAVILTLTIPDVFFAFDKSTLRPDATQALTVVMRALTVGYPRGQVTVTGYTDDVGTRAYNIGLSQRRATTVARRLERRGIPTSRLTIAWNGEADPVASNATAQGRAKNRRVTISIRTGHS